MKKLAIFVEGYTELQFVNSLLEKIAGEHSIRIEQRQIRGGTNARRTMALVKAAKPDDGQKYYVLLFDCGGDRLVKDRIREEHEGLSNKQFLKIIGIRDVRPDYTYAEIPKLEAGLPKYIKTSLIPVEFILSVMELEAWFLAEFNHFPKIDPVITIPKIKETLGFDPENDDMEIRSEPTNDLIACYAIAGKAYEKGNATGTIDALDYDFLYVELPQKINYLNRLVNSIDTFLA